jgi:hypothetical protein
MAQNDRLTKQGNGSEGFVLICSETLHVTPNVYPEELRPKWMNESICNIPPSEFDDIWLNRSTLAGSQMGWKETTIWIRISCLAELHTLQWILLKSMVKYLDGISNGLGCVSQHRNRSMVVVSSRNPQNSKVDSPPPLGTLNIKS